jgi:hypothetical protein
MDDQTNVQNQRLGNFGFLQVATVLAATDVKAAAFASNMLQQETLLNNNLRRQGLPEAEVLSLSYPEVCSD